MVVVFIAMAVEKGSDSRIAPWLKIPPVREVVEYTVIDMSVFGLISRIVYYGMTHLMNSAE